MAPQKEVTGPVSPALQAPSSTALVSTLPLSAPLPTEPASSAIAAQPPRCGEDCGRGEDQGRGPSGEEDGLEGAKPIRKPRLRKQR